MTNAAAVARALKNGGLITAPRHGRDGLWVANGHRKGLVTLGVNYTETFIPAWAKRLVADATEVLTEAGYAVEAFGDDLHHHVTKEA